MAVGIVGVISAWNSSASGEDSKWPAGRWIDLTHSFSSDTIYWPTEDGFSLTVKSHGMTDEGYFYSANSFQSAEHGGTHIDAPIHFARDRQTVDQIPITNLIGPADLVDISGKTGVDPDYEVKIEDLLDWEKQFGILPDGAIVLLRTGFHKFWPDRRRYMGTDELGAKAVAKLHFPGLAPRAARWLVKNRNIAAVGLDTPSIDHGQSKRFRTHRILSEENIPAFENVANLDKVPPTGAFVIALPMKIKGGSGAPLRIVSFIPQP